MVPATRSGIDVSFWLLERAAAERIGMSLPKLRWLLYLAQAHYAIAREGAKLMPATFIVGEDGPLEPTLDLVFQAGLENPWTPSLNDTVESFLDGFWQRFGALPAIALHKLVVGDPAWRKAQEYGPGAEIPVDLHRAAKSGGKTLAARLPNHSDASKRAAALPPFAEEVKAKIEEHQRNSLGRVIRGTGPKAPGAKPAPAEGAHLRAVPPDNQEIRFTADGRSVTRWRPKRRVDGPTI